MDILNLHRNKVRQLKAIDPSAEALGVWVKAVFCCFDNLTGGVIHGAAKWTDDQWRNRADLRLSEVKECPLMRFGRYDVTVLMYPQECEERFRKQRAAAAKTNETRWGSEKDESGSDSPSDSPSESVGSEHSESVKRKRKRKGKRTPSTPQGGDQASGGVSPAVARILSIPALKGATADMIAAALASVPGTGDQFATDAFIDFLALEAIKAGRIFAPGSWVEKQCRNFVKKNAPPSGAGRFVRMRTRDGRDIMGDPTTVAEVEPGRRVVQTDSGGFEDLE